jgi:radical SAM superfamily enzyme YgiQ (UPF0313 family)
VYKRQDIVALNVITSSYNNASKIATIAHDMGATVLMGGVFPSFNDSWILEVNPSVDIVVRGEGESPFLEILQSFANGKSFNEVKSITYRTRFGEIIRNKDAAFADLSSLSLPNYELLDMDELLRKDIPFDYQTTRGCTQNCAFCTLQELWGGYREYPFKIVACGLQSLSNYGVKKVRIVDDTFTLKTGRAKQLCETIANMQLNLELCVLTRVDKVNRTLLQVMYNAGVRDILYGVESASSQIIFDMEKTVLSEDWLKISAQAINDALNVGMRVNPIFIIGWPGETKETLSSLKKYVKLICSNDAVKPFFSFVTPHPGSMLARQAHVMGLDIICEDLDKYTHLFPVAIPRSLGHRGLQTLTGIYNELVEVSRSEDRNPYLDYDEVKNCSIE